MKNLEHELFLIADDMDEIGFILDFARVAAGHAYGDVEELAGLVPVWGGYRKARRQLC